MPPTASTTPHEIVPRRIRVALGAHVPKYWLGGDPASTHLVNALSVGFPRGERFFVDAVRRFKDRITDDALADAVRRFVAQESNHSRAHEDFNDWLRGHGLPVDAVEAHTERDMSRGEATLSPEILLAVTAALEHFTAIFAAALLDAPGFLDAVDPSVRSLWLWHALEELEHKAVAFDVYRHVDGRESVRVVTMFVLTLLFVHDLGRQQHAFMRADGHGLDVKSYARFVGRFFGPRGYMKGTLRPYLAYYRPGFHPNDQDTNALLARARRQLDALLAAA